MAKVTEERLLLPSKYQKQSHNSAKIWVSIKSNKIVDVIFMSDCPKNTDFLTFRNNSKKKLEKTGKVQSGYVVYFPSQKKNYFAFLTDGDKKWYK